MKFVNLNQILVYCCFAVAATFVVAFEIPKAKAQAVKNYQVEGHVFSSQTLRPLPGVKVELWGFFTDASQEAYVAVTDEGGFYVIDYPPSVAELNGAQKKQGYAFAYICEYSGKRKVHIVPLYTAIERGQVYRRNVYLNVPKNVFGCDQLQ